MKKPDFALEGRVDGLWRAKSQVHPFLNPKHETHLVATLFENLVILPRIQVVDETSSLDLGVGHVTEVNWGYEVWGGNHKRANCVDVAIHFRDEHGEGVIVVEAKRPGGTLKPSDCDPGSYLNLPSFTFAERRALLYLVGANDVEKVKKKIVPTTEHHWGVFSWEEFAGLQIGLSGQNQSSSRRSARQIGSLKNGSCRGLRDARRTRFSRLSASGREPILIERRPTLPDPAAAAPRDPPGRAVSTRR